MTREYEYRCHACGATYITHEPADRLDRCATAGCEGVPRRRWSSVNFNRVPGGGRD